MAKSSAQRKRAMRFAAILSLALLAIVFVLYSYLDIASYNAACRQERGYDLAYDHSTPMTAIVGFIVLALPCVIVRGSFALGIYALLSGLVTVLWTLSLFEAAGPPIQCLTMDGDRPDNFALFGVAIVIAMAAAFYVILIVDLALFLLRRLTALTSSRLTER